MRISTDYLETCAIVHLAGEFGTLDCPAFLDEVEGVLGDGRQHVVLNLRLTKYINSTALGAIIKASKAAQAKGGKLVISRPSSVCRNAITGVGLDQIVPIFDDDDLAVAGLEDAEPAADIDAAKPIGEEDSTLLFSPTDQDHLHRFVAKSPRSKRGWHGVGHMAELDTSTLRFFWDGGNTGLSAAQMAAMLSPGVELKVKFRLPLLQRGYHEAVVTVGESHEEADGVRVAATYKQIAPETADAVRQYAEDMSFLKNELTRSTQGLGRHG